jgi:aryl-alcohol dehydrogenase-like predicted oxidoreductase
MWKTLDAVKAIAAEIGRTPADVSLAWVYGGPGMTSTLLGATRVEQLDANIAAAEIELPAAARARLDAASALDLGHPYDMFTETFQAMLHGGASVGS